MANNIARQFGEAVRAPKMAELIADRLRSQIVRGQLPLGAALPPEGVLMGQFGVSRPTLREAYRILETESLITIRRGARGGAMVMAPDIAVAARYVGLLLQLDGTTIADVYEARSTLEPACARLMAQRRDRSTLRRLTASADDLQKLLDTGIAAAPDTDAWARGTYRFHEQLLIGSGNKTLALQGALLQEVVAMHVSITVARALAGPGAAESFGKTVRSFRKLIALVEARDADGAEAHWRAHMEGAAKLLLKHDLRDKRVVELFA